MRIVLGARPIRRSDFPQRPSADAPFARGNDRKPSHRRADSHREGQHEHHTSFHPFSGAHASVWLPWPRRLGAHQRYADLRCMDGAMGAVRPPKRHWKTALACAPTRPVATLSSHRRLPRARAGHPATRRNPPSPSATTSIAKARNAPRSRTTRHRPRPTPPPRFSWAGGALVLANAAHGNRLLTIAPDADHDNAGVETCGHSALSSRTMPTVPHQDELSRWCPMWLPASATMPTPRFTISRTTAAQVRTSVASRRSRAWPASRRCCWPRSMCPNPHRCCWLVARCWCCA